MTRDEAAVLAAALAELRAATEAVAEAVAACDEDEYDTAQHARHQAGRRVRELATTGREL